MASIRTLSFYLHEFSLQPGSFGSKYMRKFARSIDPCRYGSNELGYNGGSVMILGELIY